MDEGRSEQRDHVEGGSFAPGNSYAFPKGVSGNPGGRPKSTLPRVMRDLLERCTLEEIERIAHDRTNHKAVEVLAAADLLDALLREEKNQRTNPSRTRVWERMVGLPGKDDAISDDAGKRTRMVVEYREVKEDDDGMQGQEGEG